MLRSVINKSKEPFGFNKNPNGSLQLVDNFYKKEVLSLLNIKLIWIPKTLRKFYNQKKQNCKWF
jgi:hypothetical protein